MNIFVLEDEIDRYPRNQITSALINHELTVARSFADAKARYVCGKYDILLLDHDMEGYYADSEEPNTGYQFVKWLVEQNEQPKPEVILHSQNPVGRQNMHLLLRDHGYTKITEFAFGPRYVEALKSI